MPHVELLTADEGVVGMVGRRMLVLVLPLLCVSCGGADVPRDVATSGENRGAVVTDCGTFDLGQGDHLPDSVLRCFVDAVAAGRPAQLKVTRPTVEGDPIATTYRADRQGRVDVVTDSRQDRFGIQTISKQVCTGPAVVEDDLSFTACTAPISTKD
ncbi:MAG TPA: DUF4362 domain-containing protein [Pilimelia sp.]|nr:DUF4362 domain-containing protein [Pilimelia sp.]